MNSGPVYWMHETTGKMKRIVTKFLNNQPLSAEELGVIRWYIMQFVKAMPGKPDDWQRIKDMNQEEIKNYVWDVLLDYGIDPF